MKPMMFVCRLICIALLVIVLQSCDRNTEVKPISVAPEIGSVAARAQNLSRRSQIGLRAKVSYQVFSELIHQHVPAVHEGAGNERKCERVIGIKVCGTADWQFSVRRGNTIQVSGHDDTVVLLMPVEFSGTAGVRGDIARSLGLSNLDFSGALEATIKLGFDLDANWCPTIATDITYAWTQTPKVEWIGGMDVNIKKYLSDEIDKQLSELPEKLRESIQCDQFRAELAKHWRSYSFPLNLTDDQTMHLNLTPQGFRFSGVHTDESHLGVSFVLEANAVAESAPLDSQQLTLPQLRSIEYKPGKLVFELLVRREYKHLQALAEPELIGQTFTSETALGQTSIVVRDLRIYRSEQGMTIAIEFDADLPATRSNTSGIVYLTATPEIDTFNQQIRLANISLTKVLDSKLWDKLSILFESKILASIRHNAIVDLKPRIKQLESELLNQLSDPTNTEGVLVEANDLTISVSDLTAEDDALAAVLQLNATLDLQLPLSVFENLAD